MGPVKLERLDDRLNAFETALKAALPTRIIKRELMHFDKHTAAEISAGVLMLVSKGEGSYSQVPGMVAKEGTLYLTLIGHLKLAETNTGQELETAEINFIEEIKAALRINVPGMSLKLNNIDQSAQLDFPYGWLVASVDVTPPQQNTY